MKNCHGTFHYTFSPFTRERLVHYQLLTESTPKSEEFGIRYRHLWLTTTSQPFCIEYREILDEDLNENLHTKSLSALCPGFIEEIYLPKVSPSPYRLKGLLLQKNPELQNSLESVTFPCEIIWAEPEKEHLDYQFCYRKIFPFWALVLECDDLLKVPHKEELIYIKNWRQREVLWLQQETISWDILFTAPASKDLARNNS